jgi:hypothetical protein
MGPDDEVPPEDLPPDHPHVAHGQAAQEGVPGMFTPPEDTEREDASLPVGSISVELRDPDDRPLAGQQVDVGEVVQSVAKGESRKHFSGISDAAGLASFSGLDTGSGFAFRVTAPKDGASFAAMPFQLAQDKGMRVVLHVYPVTHEVDAAKIVDPRTGEQRGAIFLQNLVYAEIRDDRIQFEQVLTVFNLGRTAWVPNDLVLPLPEGFTALTSQQQMSDQGIDPIEKHGARLRGTFGPGRHVVDYRWQLPWSGDSEIDADIGMPPHVFQAIVMTPYAAPIKLVVDGFPEPKTRTDNQGQKILVTQADATDKPLTHVHLALKDLPTPGPARWLATFAAAFGIIAGLGFAVSTARAPQGKRRGAGGGDARSERQQLLAELEDLERAHRDGEVGPQTYERARRELIDAIARTLTKESST